MGTFLCNPEFKALSTELKAADAAAAAAAQPSVPVDDLTAQMDRAKLLPAYGGMHSCVESAMVEGVGHLIPTAGGLQGTFDLITLPRRMWMEASGTSLRGCVPC